MWLWAFSFCFLTQDLLAESAIFVWVLLSRQTVVSQHVHRSALLWLLSKDLNIFSCSFLQLESTNAYSAFRAETDLFNGLGTALRLRRCWVSYTSVWVNAVALTFGSHTKGHWTALLDLVQNHGCTMSMMTMTTADIKCLLNARHPHRTTVVLVLLSHKCGNWGTEL